MRLALNDLMTMRVWLWCSLRIMLHDLMAMRSKVNDNYDEKLCECVGGASALKQKRIMTMRSKVTDNDDEKQGE